MYRCIEKQRDKNRVINGYIIQDISGGTSVQVTPQLLKQKISSGAISVSNLTLTSDGRLVDHDDSEFIKQSLQRLDQADNNRRALVSKYSNGNNGKQLGYVMNKLKSKRVGRIATKALLIGLTCVSLSSLTACSTNEPLAVNTESQTETKELTFDEKLELLNLASIISADVHIFSINKQVDISVDGQDIGTLSGKFVKIFEKMTFSDSDDNVIAVGNQNEHLMFDNWTVYDKDGNVLYTMAEEFTIIFNKYKILDADQNEVGYIEGEFAIGKKATIYDMNDNEIAVITRAPLRKDFTIEVKDNSKMDNVSITTISTNYMMKLMQEEESSNHHNSDDD